MKDKNLNMLNSQIKSKMKIKTSVTFDAAHYLPNYKGACKFIHGHTFKVDCEIEGKINKETGMVIDFVILKNILQQYDHDFINKPQRGQKSIEIPTAENLALYFAEVIKEFPRVDYVTIKVWESPKSYAQKTLPEEE